MSGLIWAGLGKGIADAGATIGNSIMKQYELTERERLELEREERADARLAEREDRKTAKDKAETEARAKLVRDSYTEAEDMPMKRDAAGLLSYGKRNFGAEGEMSEADMETIRNMPDAARKIYEEEGAVNKRLDPRLQREQDAAEVAAGKGADSKTMDYFEDAKKKVIDAIKEENRVVIAEKNEAGRDKRAELNRAADAELSSQQHRQTLAAISARQSGGSDGKRDTGVSDALKFLDSQRKSWSAELADLRDRRKVLDSAMGMKKEEKASKLQAIDDQQTAIQEKITNADKKYDQLSSKLFGDQPSAKPSTSKPAGGQSSAPVKVGDKSAYDALPSGTRYIAPDGSIRTKK